MKIKADYVNEPQWKILTVKATLPEELKCLNEMAHNMCETQPRDAVGTPDVRT